MSINLKKVPSTPGVYKFFNNHEIIYIGKAKDLKKRVSSYFGKSIKDRKTSQIKFLTDKIETFTSGIGVRYRTSSGLGFGFNYSYHGYEYLGDVNKLSIQILF